MKIYVISNDALCDWNVAHGTDFNHCDLTDEQFKQIAEKNGWKFDSTEELIAEMNADGPYAPTSTHHYMRTIEEPKEYFRITSVHRDDLRANGFDPDGVDDETMSELASKMADDYISQLFHSSLSIIAEEMGIPKLEETEFRKKALDVWNRRHQEARWEKFDEPDDHCADCNILLEAEGLTFEGYGQVSSGEKEIIELSVTTEDGKTYDLISE